MEIVALLNAAGIHTLGDIDDKSDEQLLKIAGITENNIAAVSALRNQGGNRMTFFSTKCVNCTENSKRVISKWISRDEKGKFVAFSYECRNYGCSIQYGRNKKRNRFANQNEKEM